MQLKNTELEYYLEDLSTEMLENLAKHQSMKLTLSQFRDLVNNNLSEEFIENIITTCKENILNSAPDEASYVEIEKILNTDNNVLVKQYMQHFKNQAFFNFIEIKKEFEL